MLHINPVPILNMELVWEKEVYDTIDILIISKEAPPLLNNLINTHTYLFGVLYYFFDAQIVPLLLGFKMLKFPSKSNV